MEHSESRRCVLFADICGTTPLYADTGNLVALRLVAERLDEMSRIVVEEGGTVIRSKGDDLLCTFDAPSAALAAAHRITAARAGAALDVRATIHVGEIIEARADIFGDAVNVAARLLALARAGEVLVSDVLFEALPSVDQKALQFFDRQILRGLSHPLDVYKVAPIDVDHTFTQDARGAEAPHGVAVRLAYADQRHTVTERDGPFLLGRARSCHLVMSARCVSRVHAVVEARGDKVSITDRSSLGTWVHSSTGDIRLRREAQFLTGRGRLSLGDPSLEEVSVSFELMRTGLGRPAGEPRPGLPPDGT